MKILFAIQGTGNGHISRAREIVPLLEQYGTVDLLISGSQADVSLTQEIKYRFHGFSYVFGKKGGIDFWKTFKSMDLRRFFRDMHSVPFKTYDIIINDFEPITAWACKRYKLHSVSLSHQASFLSKNTPRPKKRGLLAELILKYYAPTTQQIGFHFKSYDSFIRTPVIRNEIRRLQPQNKGHYTVYLPAVDDKLIVQYLHQLPDVQWEVFSKHQRTPYRYKNVKVQYIDNEGFNQSLASSAGLFTGGGFEGPAEALFLKKKVIMMPMKDQFEQACNAAAAEELGIPIIHQINDDLVPTLRNWVDSDEKVNIHFPDETAEVVDSLIKNFGTKRN
ncbi:glycosyltransferase family protein [Pelobium manganitolerans]|uniref:glycosyltransferase family protein n=1 Tax=Pelobium manganitolerans TaxID=1842495 RepID=UPI003FA34D4A